MRVIHAWPCACWFLLGRPRKFETRAEDPSAWTKTGGQAWRTKVARTSRNTQHEIKGTVAVLRAHARLDIYQYIYTNIYHYLYSFKGHEQPGLISSRGLGLSQNSLKNRSRFFALRGALLAPLGPPLADFGSHFGAPGRPKSDPNPARRAKNKKTRPKAET